MTQDNVPAPAQAASGKHQRLMKLSDKRGVIAALAIDQRGSLQRAFAAITDRKITPSEISEFKSLVSEILTPYASAILLDPEYGLEAARQRAANAGLLLAYENSGYDTTTPGRFPLLLPNLSARRLAEVGADAVKLLVYYDPDDEAAINTVKQAFIERVGAECIANALPFFVEIVTYSDRIGNVNSLEFARAKPDKVRKVTREFSNPRYGIDVLKLEVPVNMQFVQAATSNGSLAYTREEARQYFSAVAAEASIPFIYLSAGVSSETFLSALELANEAEVPYAGVLCGRATWQDGLPVYVNGGTPALRTWLENQGRQNIEALNAVLSKGAQPWWKAARAPL
ncbi:MAG TPA: tagatose 1,6-diphosphate aldolase [Ktedonobacteraceae bacterium]|nr:tagatose 1,6-diphosphate aldolase [Ktedonobacteraceae bacterium]